jgi:ketosteroid isomerase-like protein
MRFLVALIGLAIGFAMPVLAQENDTVYPQTRQEIEAVDTKLDEAINKNDAAAAAALFTEDAILMLPLEYAPERSGLFSGRQAIEKWFARSSSNTMSPTARASSIRFTQSMLVCGQSENGLIL